MKEQNSRKENRLIHEKSPYLLQHAHNPVDWFPWSEEAFSKAKNEDKPVFLSIGYSTCHWCHVMEKESFEDHEVASLMNEAFVSIKVDREERPDIDNIYMTVCQMLTGSGGWPLTIIMTPDKKPFFAATYIPKHDRFGRTGMIELVPRLKEIWQARRKDVLHSADQITDALQQSVSVSSGPPVGESALHNGYRQIAQRFDRVFGGFGDSPKFPTPHQFSFLLRYWHRTRDPHALEIVEKSLQHMRRGGIYDHVGFGFHRYSTDREWLVPHFEKMLYDQALLVIAYIEAFQVTGNPEYAETVREILTYVVSDMTSPEGAFFSAEDADSEGVEGKFYVWTPQEIREILGEEDAAFFMKIWNVEENGNFYDQATGQRSQENILHLRKPIAELAALYELPESELRKRIEIAREKLYRFREQRIHPHKDDKVLTDWNGLMIAAMAKAARVLDDAAYVTAATRAANFLLSRMKQTDGSLLHRFRAGQAGLTGTLDDYAFLVWGLIELYETTFEVRYLKNAIQLNDYSLQHFWDDKAGGFFFTSDAGEELLVRNKEIYDGAIPSGNSVSMLNLLRLARMTGRSEWEDKASAIERAFSQQITQIPSGHTQLLIAVDFAVGPSFEVVIAGDQDQENTGAMLKVLRRSFVPNKVVLFRPAMDADPEISQLAPYTKHQQSIDEKPTAYVCRNFVCNKPTTSVEEMLHMLTSEA